MTKQRNALLSAQDGRGLLANAGVGMAETLAVSVGIVALGWMSPGPADVGAVSGAVVAPVWTGLTGGLGAARWLAGRSVDSARRPKRTVVSLLKPENKAKLQGILLNLALSIVLPRGIQRGGNPCHPLPGPKI